MTPLPDDLKETLKQARGLLDPYERIAKLEAALKAADELRRVAEAEAMNGPNPMLMKAIDDYHKLRAEVGRIGGGEPEYDCSMCHDKVVGAWPCPKCGRPPR